ncbi:MAG: hypothetical protein M3O70_18750 [Actinomycetota bacterium]|nr:hypothetical protein [Actinomycetota bacterium]
MSEFVMTDSFERARQLCLAAMSGRDPAGQTVQDHGTSFRFLPATRLPTFLVVRMGERAQFSEHVLVELTSFLRTKVPLNGATLAALAAANASETTGRWEWMRRDEEGVHGDVARRTSVVVGPSVGQWLEAAWPLLVEEHLRASVTGFEDMKADVEGQAIEPWADAPEELSLRQWSEVAPEGSLLHEAVEAVLREQSAYGMGQWSVKSSEATWCDMYAPLDPTASGADEAIIQGGAVLRVLASAAVNHPMVGPGFMLGMELPDRLRVPEEEALVRLQNLSAAALANWLVPRLGTWLWTREATRYASFLPAGLVAAIEDRSDAVALIAHVLRTLPSMAEQVALDQGIGRATPVAELVARAADLPEAERAVIRDHGPEAVAFLHDERLKPDPEWESLFADGFRWWPTPLSQTVWADSAVRDFGCEIAMLRSETDIFLLEASGEEPPEWRRVYELLQDMNHHMFNMVAALDEERASIRLYSAMPLHGQNRWWTVPWMGEATAVAAGLAVDFVRRYPLGDLGLLPLAAPGPDGTIREELDEILAVLPVLRSKGEEAGAVVGEVLYRWIEELSDNPDQLRRSGDDLVTTLPLYDTDRTRRVGVQHIRIQPEADSEVLGPAARITLVPELDLAWPVEPNAAGASVLNSAMVAASGILPYVGPWAAIDEERLVVTSLFPSYAVAGLIGDDLVAMLANCYLGLGIQVSRTLDLFWGQQSL